MSALTLPTRNNSIEVYEGILINSNGRRIYSLHNHIIRGCKATSGSNRGHNSCSATCQSPLISGTQKTRETHTLNSSTDMTTQKAITIGGLALSLTAASSTFAATTFSDDFEAPPYGGVNSPIHGINGWVADKPVGDLSGDDLSFVATWNGSQSAGLGGAFDTPSGTTGAVNLDHSISRSLSDTSFSVDFAVIAPVFEIGADTFGFSFLGSSGDLFRIAFEAPGGVSGDLEVAWYDGATRNVLTPISLDIFYGSTYTLTVDFSDSGADTLFSADIIAGAVSTPFGGTITGTAGAGLTGIGADYIVVDDGDSYLVFDNLVVVPEPQTWLLTMSCLFGLMLRRRR